MSKEKQKYWVELSHKIDTNYTIEADSKEQVERVFNKMFEDATISETGIDWNSDLIKEAENGEVRKGGLAICDRSALLSLEYEGHSGERIEKIEEISKHIG